ncbi:MAG: beta-hydroxyacyl-ACP dehydratase [Clostridiales bacterium]|jgi:3-hydroxyacyl-[acyl-carrier-protein] dehydratase|nr:beta-hydroxyacyl-ACP dehydratase [Clostridiales bacterium]
MEINELKEILPHREPMLLIDEAYVGSDGIAYGSRYIRGDEWFLQGHFPNEPVVPGVIQCEMAAQTCCVLLADKLKNRIALFSGINNVKFKSIVKPKDTIRFECELVKEKAMFCFTEIKGYVDEKLCVTGELSFAIIDSIR